MPVHDVFIKNIKIQNYRSLEDVSITLNKGLNVIIGDNGAGKSNFLRFLDKPLMDSFLTLVYGQRAVEHTRGNLNYFLDVEYKDDADQNQLQIEYCSRSKNPAIKVPYIKYKKFRNGTQVEHMPETLTHLPDNLNLRNDQIRFAIADLGFLIKGTLVPFNSPERISYITNPGKISLTSEASLVAEDTAPYHTDTYISPLFSDFDSEIDQQISNNDRRPKSQKEMILEAIFSWFRKKKKESDYASLLKKYSPITDIKLNENINIYETGYNTIVENIVLNFKINNNWVPWSFLSDGTKRLFHMITEVIFSASHIILVEEPELGIHPNQLFRLMDFLKSESQKKQIIITTHSPISLDVISPDELDLIIIAKMTKKGTILNHLDEQQKSKATAYIKKVGNLSAYWLHSDLEQ